VQILPKNQTQSLSIGQVRIKQLAVNFDRAKCRSCATNAVVKHVRSSATARRLYSIWFQMSTFQVHQQEKASDLWKVDLESQNRRKIHTKIIEKNQMPIAYCTRILSFLWRLRYAPSRPKRKTVKLYICIVVKRWLKSSQQQFFFSWGLNPNSKQQAEGIGHPTEQSKKPCMAWSSSEGPWK